MILLALNKSLRDMNTLSHYEGENEDVHESNSLKMTQKPSIQSSTDMNTPSHIAGDDGEDEDVS